MRSTSLSLTEARRLAVAAQGFGAPRPPAPNAGHLRRLAERLLGFQIDSVNVLVRAHYVPAFARLGPYPVAALDSLAYRRHELFEFWGHAACLMPLALYPLLRYRMDPRAAWTLDYMRSSQGAPLAAIYDEVRSRGPLAVDQLSDPGRGSGKWWGWSFGKLALEHLYDAGLVAIAGRRGFDRLYDLAERVIPRSALEAPAPPREEAMKQLICLGAKACGVGTLSDVTGYLHVDGWRERGAPVAWWESRKGSNGRPTKPIAKRLLAELVEEGRLLPTSVEGWADPAYLHPDARLPRSIEARAIVSPFDSLLWGRQPGIQRLFGMAFPIEMYVPPPKRIYGYYVCPFLLGDSLVARCDLKADRQRGVLVVQAAFLEPGQDAHRVAPELAAELRLMREWLGLDGIEVAERGNLAPNLLRSLRG